jgi:hypothetical protein
MTDVVKIAKECRETLAAEIAKLDEFLLMAEKLLKFGRLDSVKAPEIDDEETTELTSPAKIRPFSPGAGANGLDTKA